MKTKIIILIVIALGIFMLLKSQTPKKQIKPRISPLPRPNKNNKGNKISFGDVLSSGLDVGEEIVKNKLSQNG